MTPARLLFAPVRFLAVVVAVVGCLVLWPILAVHDAFWRDVLRDDDAPIT